MEGCPIEALWGNNKKQSLELKKNCEKQHKMVFDLEIITYGMGTFPLGGGVDMHTPSQGISFI